MALPQTTTPKQGDTATTSAMKASLALIGQTAAPSPPAGSGLMTLVPKQGDTLELSLRKLNGLLVQGAGGSGGGGGISFTTAEQFTGLTWVDGKKVYQKTVQCSHLAAGSAVVIGTHGIVNLMHLVHLWGIAEGGGYLIPLPFVSGSNAPASAGLLISGPSILCDCGSDQSMFTYVYVTIQYTCTDR